MTTKRKKCLTEFQLKNILARGSATEEEIELMREMFQALHGVNYFGMCLHPQWLLKALDDERDGIEEDETEEVKAWLDREIAEEFDPVEYAKTNPPITIICEEPDNCRSRQKHGNACRCIRENFRNQADFKDWQESKLRELKDKIIELINEKN